MTEHFQKHLADRRQARKRGEPASLPPAAAQALTQFGADLATGEPDEVAVAIQKAAASIIAGAVARVQAEIAPPMPAETVDFGKRGGDAWSEIQTAAVKWAAASGKTRTPEAAVAGYLETPAGKKAYSRYLEEAEGVATKHARARLAPPERR